MKLIRLPALILATLIQFAPVARLVQVTLPFQASPLAIILRWVAGAVAVAGAFHTVSGASTTTIKVTGTNGTLGVSMTMRIVVQEGNNTYMPEAYSFNGVYITKPPTTVVSNGLPLGQKYSLATLIINGKPQEAGAFPQHYIAYRWDTNATPLGGTRLDEHGMLQKQAFLPLDFTISVQPNPDFPTVTNPGGVTVNVGEPILLSVTATGAPPLAIQWIHDGSNVTDGTAATLNIPSARLEDAGSYSVRVTNTLGKVVSNPATVIVNEVSGPTITVHPQDATLHPGEALSMSVTAESAMPLTFQWRHGETDVDGATTAQLNLPSITTDDAGDYMAVVTSNGKSATSNPGKLTVVPLVVQLPVFGPTDVTLTFSTIPGRTYAIEANSSFDPTGWSVLKQVPADGATASASDPTIDQPSRNWRVHAAP